MIIKIIKNSICHTPNAQSPEETTMRQIKFNLSSFYTNVHSSTKWGAHYLKSQVAAGQNIERFEAWMGGDITFEIRQRTDAKLFFFLFRIEKSLSRN